MMMTARLTGLLPGVLLGLAIPLGCFAASQDAFDSPECRAARAELDRAIEAAQPGSSPNARLQHARAEAATACLRAESDHRERSGIATPPQAIPAPVIEGRTTPAPRPAVALPAPALEIARPVPITICDPGGCWDANGRRLNGTGPVLAGPRGPCSVSNGVASCP